MARTAVVIGAGPVGCLAALSFAKLGWRVHIYEGRSETTFKSPGLSKGRRSINLAISARGIAALEAVDARLAAECLENMIPMKGRFIHSENGAESKQMYDLKGQCINSVDRGLLNNILLRATMEHPEIQVSFKHKLSLVDFDKKWMTVETAEADGTKLEKRVTFDFCVGADGSYSNVRRQMMRVVRMDFQQEYLSHDYLELHIPAGHNSLGETTFLLDPNSLHIWPRHSFMLIALPNKDKSFTCTLFAPTNMLDQLANRDDISSWFGRNFPDVVPLMGEEQLINDFFANPRSSLICIKSKPYHYKDRAVIIGDAAHSMVPFYGQGLNCGFEDVRVLDTIMRQHLVDPSDLFDSDEIDLRMSDTLSSYSQTRHDDLTAICDLAMENYEEMRHSVTTPSYLLRKFIDNALSRLTPHKPTPWAANALKSTPFPSSWAGGWLPLYTMVTFRPDLSYSTVRKQAHLQLMIMRAVGWVAGLGVASLIFNRTFNLKSTLFYR